jgi:hypothetical protein
MTAERNAMKSIACKVTGLCVAGSALLLAACGGGGGGAAGVDAPVAAPPGGLASATTSSAGALAFVRAVAATSESGAEPITIGDAALATSETDEPDPGI